MNLLSCKANYTRHIPILLFAGSWIVLTLEAFQITLNTFQITQDTF
jgi:hypothetical protein